MIQSCLNSGLIVYQVFFPKNPWFDRIYLLLVGLRYPSQVQVQIEASSKVSTDWCFSRLRPVMEKLLHSKSLSPAFHMFSGKVLKQWSNVTFVCVFFHWQKKHPNLLFSTKMLLLDRKKHQHILLVKGKKDIRNQSPSFQVELLLALGIPRFFFQVLQLSEELLVFLVHKYLCKLTAVTPKINRF